jgi:ABC-type dipeptide/oligopeptide/nickel transport system permease component
MPGARAGARLSRSVGSPRRHPAAHGAVPARARQRPWNPSGATVTTYLLRRVLGLIPVLFGVSLLLFTITRLIPGDPAVALLGQRASPAALAQLRQDLGLDRPVWINLGAVREQGPTVLVESQYFRYMGDLLRGDLGRSIFSRIPVAHSLFQRFPATFELSFFAMLFSLAVGIPAGVSAALHRGRMLDTVIMAIAVSGVSLPVFWLAIIFIYVFAVNLGWLPPSGRLGVDVALQPITNLYTIDSLLRGQWSVFADAVRHLILPAVALGTIPLAIVVRMTRSAMLEVLGQDYVRTARSKGVWERHVILKHALRNALLPVVTVVGLSFGRLLSGAILTETVFSWPGIGRWIYDAISARDYPIIQGGILFIAVVVALVNLLVDLLYAVIDPRIQYT